MQVVINLGSLKKVHPRTTLTLENGISDLRKYCFGSPGVREPRLGTTGLKLQHSGTTVYRSGYLAYRLVFCLCSSYRIRTIFITTLKIGKSMSTHYTNVNAPFIFAFIGTDHIKGLT